MTENINNKETIKQKTIEDMQKLGTYKTEYEPIINIYSEMREQYELYTSQLKAFNYKCDENTGAGGTKKSALIATIETLRKDILQYSDRLQLNPKALADMKNNSGKKESKLSQILKELEQRE